MNELTMLNSLVPAPAEAMRTEGVLAAASLRQLGCPAGLERFGDMVTELFRTFGLELKPETGAGDLELRLDAALPASGFAIDIAADGIRVAGGDSAGLFYAVGALRQLAFLAFARGPKAAAFDCGRIVDRPRFGWRGFMLDSARHFQPAAKIKEVLALMAERRLNVFHWHLTDNQGWRLPSRRHPELNGLATLAAGSYTREELRDIGDFAAAHFIEIVPEIDMPGHSGGVLKLHPELACDPAHPGFEYCLGKPEVKAFLADMLAELLELLPEVKIIHLGGDEAETTHWAKCPVCRRALEASGLADFRALEGEFMRQMAEQVIALGRTPMVWFTDAAALPEATIVQAWHSLHDMTKTKAKKIVNSIHSSYYFDYPASSAEPMEKWMFPLPEESVYLAEPAVHLGDRIADRLLGAEACLWTELVAPWRVLPKIAPRLPAFAEVAWSDPGRKCYRDFLRRRDALAAAGYPV